MSDKSTTVSTPQTGQPAGDVRGPLPVSLRDTEPVSRRTLFAGAGALGAVAAAAAVLPLGPAPASLPVAPVANGLAAEGGYQLTEHVKRYYQTARV